MVHLTFRRKLRFVQGSLSRQSAATEHAVWVAGGAPSQAPGWQGGSRKVWAAPYLPFFRLVSESRVSAGFGRFLALAEGTNLGFGATDAHIAPAPG